MTIHPDQQLSGVAGGGHPQGQTLRALGLRTLFATLPLAILGFSVFWGGVQGILLPLQVQGIDRAGQNGSLALVVAVGAVASMIAAPIAGTLTDRTRSRLGGRAPWMMIGAVGTFFLAVMLSRADTITVMVLLLAAIQFTTALILTPVSAYIPDRVPAVKRGMFSAAFGLAQLIGSVLGQTIGATLAQRITTAYRVLGGLLASLVVLFSLVNVRSNLDEPRAPLDLRTVLSTFWVNPVAHPNFAWAFFGRFLLFTGYFPVQTFMLYLLQDLIGLGDGAVAAIPHLGVANLVGSVVGTLAAGLAVQKWQRTKPVIYVASAVIVLGLLVPLASPTLTSMLIYSVLAGLGMGAYISVDFVLITLVLPDGDHAGKDLGIINITTTLPQTIGVTVGGAAVALFGGYVALLPFAIVATVLGAVLLMFIRGVR